MNFDCKKHLIESSIREISDAIDLARYTINSKLIELLDKKEIVITCYGSDARAEKWNRSESSIDLLVCNKSSVLDNDLKELIIDFIEKTKDIVEDNSYYEHDEDGESYLIADEIQVGREISKLNKDNYYIDILNFSEKLYKYGNKTYPDRLIDSYHINGDRNTLILFKQKMLDDIIKDNKILKDFKKDIKSYFQEEIIRGKNIRKDYKSHFDFSSDSGLLRYDKKAYFGFKHGPMRALQYKVIEKFISFIISKKDSSLVKDFPFSIDDRLSYLYNNKVINLLNNELIELIDLYNFFKDTNEKINYMKLSKKYDGGFSYDENNDTFEIKGDKFNLIKNNLDRFVELFNKIL